MVLLIILFLVMRLVRYIFVIVLMMFELQIFVMLIFLIFFVKFFLLDYLLMLIILQWGFNVFLLMWMCLIVFGVVCWLEEIFVFLKVGLVGEDVVSRCFLLFRMIFVFVLMLIRSVVLLSVQGFLERVVVVVFVFMCFVIYGSMQICVLGLRFRLRLWVFRIMVLEVVSVNGVLFNFMGLMFKKR